jgi:hypothetical protein
MRLHCKAGKATLTMKNHFLKSNKPDSIILHLPWFMKVKSVSIKGRPLPVKDHEVVIPVDSHAIIIRWHKRADTPNLSFKKTVKNYVREYKDRYYEFYPKKLR